MPFFMKGSACVEKGEEEEGGKGREREREREVRSLF